MFCQCSKLESLPNISRWDTKNLINNDDMFYGCSNLKVIPEFEKK